MYLKNTAGQFVCFSMISATDGSPVTGITPTCRRCIDGTFAAATGTVTEDTGLGFYKMALSQADTNGNNIGYRFTGTGAIDVTVNIITTSLNPYDAVRGGMTALPNAAADAAGGLPISDAGGLDLDAKLANTNEVTAARMGALTDWINGGRLDLILDIIAADTTTDIPALIAALNNLSSAQAQTAAAAALTAYDPPTNAEMEARTLAAASYATATALQTVDDEIAVIDGIADDLKSGIIYGAAATGTLSTTQATSNLTGYADDQLIGRVIIWLTGACEGEATDITDYASASGLLTFTALTTAPGNADTFKIV